MGDSQVKMKVFFKNDIFLDTYIRRSFLANQNDRDTYVRIYVAQKSRFSYHVVDEWE